MLGLLDDNDNGKMDLGTLEKRLSEQKNSSRRASVVISSATSPAQSTSGKDGNDDSPNSSLTSPEPQKEQLPNKEDKSPDDQPEKKEAEVEELSDMMCSLVTNNCGETRYIGMFRYISRNSKLTSTQGLLRASQFSRRRVYNGLTKRPETLLSNR